MKKGVKKSLGVSTIFVDKITYIAVNGVEIGESQKGKVLNEIILLKRGKQVDSTWQELVVCTDRYNYRINFMYNAEGKQSFYVKTCQNGEMVNGKLVLPCYRDWETDRKSVV